MLKNFCTAEDTFNTPKGQQTARKKYLQMMQLIGDKPQKPQQQNNSVKKWAKKMQRQFSKGEIQMANRCMKQDQDHKPPKNINKNHNEV